LRAAALAEAAFAEQELAKSFEREQGDGEKLARQKFDDLVAQHRIDCRESARPTELPSAYFRTVEGDVAEEIEKRGAAYDLIVIARPQDKLASQPVVEAALFSTGCPVLVAPPNPPKVIGEHVMIAWNQSVPSARAVRCAMPFLETAAQVEIFSIATGAKKGASPQDIARFLASHNVEARLIVASPDRRTVGETILSKASELGVDLLVLGAFSQGRIRQLILGGVTDYALKHADLPMLMAH
jgi:nucleotide-binding universal stress UspA family protein